MARGIPAARRNGVEARGDREFAAARRAARDPAAAPVIVAPETAGYRPPELAIVVPTLNERGNIEPLLDRLEVALEGVAWEIVFVDDDSKDGTYELLRDLERCRPNVRTLRRVGRRGLSSACIEGMLATAAPFIAVMDADLQHDERALPDMLRCLQAEDVDVAVGTRFGTSGSAGEFGRLRLLISRAGSLLSRAVSKARLTDPMSGFFIVRRAFFEETVRRLSGQGFKILLDLFASSPRPVRFVEVPYHFRRRRYGESKLDTLVMLEYLKLLADKMLGGYIPVRFVLFVCVGLFGIIVHLAVLGLFFQMWAVPFHTSNVLAVLVAMTVNFNLNNILTHRDRRLRGRHLIYGHLSFYLACAIGAVANFQMARMLFELDVPWALAGLSGAIVGSVWNYGVTSTFTWKATK